MRKQLFLTAALALAGASSAAAQALPPPPNVTSIVPSATRAGSPAFALTVNGTGFLGSSTACYPAVPLSLILWNGVEQSGTSYVAGTNASVLTTTIPSSYVASPGTAQVQVRNRSCTIGVPPNYSCTCTTLANSNAATFTITSPLTASCNNPPQATVGVPYTHRLIASGGTAPYSWAPQQIAPQVFLAADGTISGTFLASDAPAVSFTVGVRDATEQVIRISCQIMVTAAPTPIISDYNPREATACGPGFSLSVSGSNFLPGVQVGIGGPIDYRSLATTYQSSTSLLAAVLRDHIMTPGSVSIVAANQVTTTSQFVWSDPRPFFIRRTPRIQTLTPARAAVGSADLPISVGGSDFVAGVTKVLWQSGAATDSLAVTRWSDTELGVVLPQRLLASTGQAQVRVVNVETANATGAVYPDTCSPPASFTIESPTLVVDATQLPAGKVGTDYRATVTASGGTRPYRFTLLTGSVPGLALTTDGVLSGRPTQAGSFPLRIQASDAGSPQQTAQRDFTLRVDPPDVAISAPASLADGRVGADYSVTFSATGGTSPYRWEMLSESPAATGLTISAAGVLSGRPQRAGSFTLRVQVSDSSSTPLRAQRDYTLTVSASDLAVSGPSTVPAAMVGTAYSVTFTAGGGTAPYQWALASGAVAGLSLSADGTLGGTPTRDGTFAIVVRVTDANSQQATRDYSVQVRLPSATASLAAPQPGSPTDQPAVTMRLAAAYPMALQGQLRITFAPNASGLPASGYMDPALRFAAGGTTLSFSVPANSTAVPLPQNGAIQLGSVAGTITVALDQLRVTGTGADVPMPSRPSVNIAVSRQAPVIVSASVQITGVTSSAFSVELDGYSTPRDLRGATFTFSAASGSRLEGQVAHTIQLSTESATWFGSNDGRNNGSRFHMRVPFTLSGASSALGSVSVTLENSSGVSTAVSGGVR